MGQWVGTQGQVKVAKKCKNTPTSDVTPSKRQTKNKKIFFSMSTRRLAESVEQGCQTYSPRAKTGPLSGWIRPAG